MGFLHTYCSLKESKPPPFGPHYSLALCLLYSDLFYHFLKGLTQELCASCSPQLRSFFFCLSHRKEGQWEVSLCQALLFPNSWLKILIHGDNSQIPLTLPSTLGSYSQLLLWSCQGEGDRCLTWWTPSSSLPFCKLAVSLVFPTSVNSAIIDSLLNLELGHYPNSSFSYTFTQYIHKTSKYILKSLFLTWLCLPSQPLVLTFSKWSLCIHFCLSWHILHPTVILLKNKNTQNHLRASWSHFRMKAEFFILGYTRAYVVWLRCALGSLSFSAFFTWHPCCSSACQAGSRFFMSHSLPLD